MARSLEKSNLNTLANASRTVGFNENFICKKPLKKSQDQDKIKEKVKHDKQPKQTEQVLQNSHVKYDNKKTQDTSHVTNEAAEFSTKNPYTKELSLGMNLNDEKVEQPKAEIEANKQPRTETEINNSAKSTQFMLSEETIQKKIALNTQEIWQENRLHDPMASLYNDMPMIMMLTNTKQEDSDGFKVVISKRKHKLKSKIAILEENKFNKLNSK
ncbi:17016_t:CDS:2, partial [Cetraspora pellucida]